MYNLLHRWSQFYDNLFKAPLSQVVVNRAMDLQIGVFWWIILFRVLLHECAAEKGKKLTSRSYKQDKIRM